ncbi:MAG TPA: ABC transporter ATP-binding protein [Gemmataceae bacterium]|nr:ABC transporter ATP-binding protein [Gemmataceae bacterium]
MMLVSTATAPAIAQATDASVAFAGVSKTYSNGIFRRRAVAALRDVSLRIESGEVFGLLGPNRAGKTTLVKLLLSLCQPTTGTIQRLGRPLSDRSTLGQVGYVHENHAFPRYLSAAALLEYYGALTLMSPERVRERVPRLLELVGIADRSREPIARFSKGMIQRLGIAQALLNEPRLLVLDEPTEGLDLNGRRLLRDVVREVRQHGGTVLLVTHILTEIEHLCDRVGVLVNGRLVHVGPLAELTQDSSGSPRSLEKTVKDLYAETNA